MVTGLLGRPTGLRHETVGHWAQAWAHWDPEVHGASDGGRAAPAARFGSSVAEPRNLGEDLDGCGQRDAPPPLGSRPQPAPQDRLTGSEPTTPEFLDRLPVAPTPGFCVPRLAPALTFALGNLSRQLGSLGRPESNPVSDQDEDERDSQPRCHISQEVGSHHNPRERNVQRPRDPESRRTHHSTSGAFPSARGVSSTK